MFCFFIKEKKHLQKEKNIAPMDFAEFIKK